MAPWISGVLALVAVVGPRIAPDTAGLVFVGPMAAILIIGVVSVARAYRKTGQIVGRSFLPLLIFAVALLVSLLLIGLQGV
jgi:hypothetical protein